MIVKLLVVGESNTKNPFHFHQQLQPNLEYTDQNKSKIFYNLSIDIFINHRLEHLTSQDVKSQTHKEQII